MASSLILLVSDAAAPAGDLRLALDQAGHAVEEATWDVAPEQVQRFRAIVADGGARDRAAAACRRWKDDAAGPIVWVAATPESRMAGWHAGVDAVLSRPLEIGELALVLDRALLQREERARLLARADESQAINQTLLQLYQQNDADYRIARRIQRSCRPAQLPEVGRLRFAVGHRERLGSAGDFYNVMRVDEDRVAFFLGDVMGQGLTSSMLAIFLHQGVVPKQIVGQKYWVLPPDEVIHRLARGLAMLGMPESPMVRMTYGLLHAQTGELTWASAGHTAPLYVPASGESAYWSGVGPWLTAGDARPTNQTRSLQPGDRVLLYTDGLHNADADLASRLAQSVVRRRSLSLPGLVEMATQDLIETTPDPDDFTMLGLEFTA